MIVSSGDILLGLVLCFVFVFFFFSNRIKNVEVGGRDEVV